MFSKWFGSLQTYKSQANMLLPSEMGHRRRLSLYAMKTVNSAYTEKNCTSRTISYDMTEVIKNSHLNRYLHNKENVQNTKFKLQGKKFKSMILSYKKDYQLHPTQKPVAFKEFN